MASRQTSSTLQRYYPYLLAAAVTITVISIYAARPRSPPRRLKRSNATRRHPHNRHQHTHTLSDPDPGGVLTNDQLLQTLNQPGESERLTPGIDIPVSVAEALTETGHAAQEARGAGSGGGLDGREGRAARRSSDQDSEFSFAGAETKENVDNQNLLTLLYTIAQDQAQRESYVHRGVTCNNCQIIPIRGIRYRCANCLDYDLCEVCEALDSAHPKTHLFYKIRIPAPFIGNPRHAQVPSYPGKPQMMAMSLGPDTLRQLGEATKFEQAELEALYEQFKVLAASDFDDTKFGIHGAISRETFDRCFIPNTHLHPPSPNLIYDRMFNFYDTKGDGLVDFEEFVIGVALTNSKTRTPEKLKRIFKGYDLNGDGYVERKDFLRMFKAFYTLSKVLVRDIVASLGDELYEQGHMDQALNGRQPISAVFTSSIPPARRSWDKPHSAEEQEGDEEDDSPVVLPSSLDHMGPEDLARVEKIRSCASTPEPGSEGEREKALEDTRRTEFWSFNTEDDDLDLPDEEKDVGSEVLYHMAVQGMNERLDMLFSAKEKAAVSVRFEDEGDDPSNKDDEGHIASNGSAEGSYREHATNGSEENGHDANGLPTNSAGISTGTTNHNPHHGILKKTSKKERDSRRKVLDEIKQRGGEGRLNYEEFEKIMTGKDASRLEFVGTWTDLASF